VPDCQRKHRLDDDSGKRFSAVEVRRIDEQNYQIDDDGSLYLANLEQCTLTVSQRSTLLLQKNCVVRCSVSDLPASI
jgi:hypothetical protein